VYNMDIKIRKREGPRQITNPTIKKGLLKAMIKSLEEHEACKKDIKKLLYRYYKYYPSDFVEGIAWTKQILSEEDIDTFVKQGVLVKSKDGNMIKLGPTGLSLISMWNNERLTKWVIVLTITTILVGIISLILQIIC